MKVRYEKPVDVHVSAGYAPILPLYDDWFKRTWSQPFYPLGAVSRLEIMFLKKAKEQWGVRLEGSYWKGDGGIPAAVIHTQTVNGGLTVAYNYLVSKQFRIAAHGGAGMACQQYAFDYNGIPGAKLGSLDPYIVLAGGGSFWFTKNWFLESEVELVTDSETGTRSVSRRPS